MPKFQELSGYAAAIAPVIDAAHVNVHAAARRSAIELAETSGVTPGFLVDLRFVLPLRSLTRPELGTIYRYGDAELGLQEHLREGTLTEDGDGVLRLTDKGLKFIHGLYDLHAAAAERVWAGYDLPELAGLVGRVLDRAERVPGGALELMAPPYEPEEGPPGLLLFNRIAALRYHRADAHAVAWREAGLSVAEIVGMKDGPLRARIEAETNVRAAAPYRILSEDERRILYDGLMDLV
ncbi:hypothetical protein ACFLIM_41620 [Nonomuraea sp. M3C6]|uniref:Uncharacterized protein n=1 Tax=Nonomuraea marmarensis TaxID=3351344 RepID=A0ABW7AQK7_9ACTN